MKNWMGTGSAALSFVLWGMLPSITSSCPRSTCGNCSPTGCSGPWCCWEACFCSSASGCPGGPARRSPAARPRAAGGPRDVHQLVHVHLVPDHGPGAGHQPRLLHDPAVQHRLCGALPQREAHPAKHLAVALALAGLAYMLFSYGQLPWFSLVMGPTSPSTASSRRR